jgi:hypothetical protein
MTLELEVGRVFMYAEITNIVWDDGVDGEGSLPDPVYGRTKMEPYYSTPTDDALRIARVEDVGTEEFENWRAYVTDYLMDKAQNLEQRGIIQCSPARMRLEDGTWL